MYKLHRTISHCFHQIHIWLFCSPVYPTDSFPYTYVHLDRPDQTCLSCSYHWIQIYISPYHEVWWSGRFDFDHVGNNDLPQLSTNHLICSNFCYGLVDAISNWWLYLDVEQYFGTWRLLEIISFSIKLFLSVNLPHNSALFQDKVSTLGQESACRYTFLVSSSWFE